jgi:hypothetical protein
MNLQQPGFLAGAVLGGAGVGAIAGLTPLFLGVRRGKTGLAVGGFLASVAGGLVAGIVGALIVAGIFSYLIVRGEQSAAGELQALPGKLKASSAAAWYLVIAFFGQTVFLAVFWSAFMAVWLGKSFISILFPAGASFGLTLGILFTAMMPFLFRAGSVRMSIFDRDDFLARLDRAAAKLRYRRVPASDGSVVYEPRALVRNEAMRMFVELSATEAVITGPIFGVKNLKKAIEKNGAPRPERDKRG